MTELFEGIPTSHEDRLLIEAYEQAGRTLDDLPYTPEFEAIFARVGNGRSRREVFHRLHNLRKAARLPRLGRAASGVPRIDPEEEKLIADMVIQRVGSLGQRDQLPYDSRIDDLAQQFNDRTGRTLTQHDIWRIIAKLAK